jgi:alpha-methylacyl-CoA racemase
VLEHWTELFEGTDACVFAANSLEEMANDPHLVSRQNLLSAFGRTQPAPAPRFSRTPASVQGPPPTIGQHNREILGMPLHEQ